MYNIDEADVSKSVEKIKNKIDKRIEKIQEDKVGFGPKITMEDILETIIKEDYYVFPDTTVTVCLLTLINGYNVLGKSACVVKSNFNVELGKKIAKEKAIEEIWQLEGYLLAEKMFNRN